jgi:hypothetical protein
MPALTAVFRGGSELKPTAGGVPPVVEYGLPGGTSFRMLRQPAAENTMAVTAAKAPPAKARLSRSIDLNSSVPGRPTPRGIAAKMSHCA